VSEASFSRVNRLDEMHIDATQVILIDMNPPRLGSRWRALRWRLDNWNRK